MNKLSLEILLLIIMLPLVTKINYITPEMSNKATPPITSTLPAKGDAIYYNNVEYLERDHTNISVLELANIVDKRELIV